MHPSTPGFAAALLQQGLTWSVRLPGGLLVAAAQLQHRVPCWGYVFQEPPAAVPPPADATPAGDAAAGARHGAEAAAGGQGQLWVRRGRKLVILGDTCESSAIAPLALGCDLLSHEATFCSGGAHPRAIVVGRSGARRTCMPLPVRRLSMPGCETRRAGLFSAWPSARYLPFCAASVAALPPPRRQPAAGVCWPPPRLQTCPRSWSAPCPLPSPTGMEQKAAIAQHSTTLQAGAFAAAVDAQRLVLTHFSAR